MRKEQVDRAAAVKKMPFVFAEAKIALRLKTLVLAAWPQIVYLSVHQLPPVWSGRMITPIS